MATTGTKQLIDIKEVRDSVLVMRNGSLRMVIEVSAINFELRSEEEQTAILQNFQRFLNSIDFPVQIVVNSRRFDISEYIKTISEAAGQLTNELLKAQAVEYGKFIEELSKLSNIMSKKFYIVVPFYVIEVAKGKGIFDSVRNLLKSSPKDQSLPEEKLQAYKTQLLQRADLVFDGLVGLGLKTRILEDQEIMQLFYELYNPGGKLAAAPVND
ncbi:MAG: hypothetical protein KW806_01450 [Candidatus Yanofskybacteria bacterium]|nr:hypothetical protein [Candidatus Yanofskybacteria bacterium]